MSLANIYYLRRVAPSAAKPCFICYKPTISVLITPDNRDFFYTCDGHLKDKGFASPLVSKEEEEAKQKEYAMARAIEEVKQEYEEKQTAKKKEKKQKEDGKDEEKDAKKEIAKKDEKEGDEKLKAIDASNETGTPLEPRIFELHKNIYQMRVTRIKNALQAKRTAEQLKNPSTFPPVPTGDPSLQK